MMYVEKTETRSFKILLKSFHENYSDLFKKTTRYLGSYIRVVSVVYGLIFDSLAD